jgi:hypothetical protein
MRTQHDSIKTTAPESTNSDNSTNPDAGYRWFLDNYDEILTCSNEITFLAQLQQIETDNDLPAGTAQRFAIIYNEVSTVPEHEESRHMAAWDAYHAALDADSNLATIARVYGERTRIALCDRINAEGTFIF